MPRVKKLKVTTQHDSVKIGAHLGVSFQRTLRIPDDGGRYPLPPSLGQFPVCRIEDFRSAVPDAWKNHGGVFLPMWQREAMWLRFSGASFRPYALKVAVGKVCALSGEPYNQQLHAETGRHETQNYMVVPGQPWLDGINVGDGVIRQFIAMPLGMGYTVEGQVTGEERFGGIQLTAFDSKPGRFPYHPPRPVYGGVRYRGAPQPFGTPEVFPSPPAFGDAAGAPAPYPAFSLDMETSCLAAPASAYPPSMPARGQTVNSSPKMRRARGASLPKSAEMGLGAGGRMEQQIHPDPYGPDTWDTLRLGRCYVHIVNSQMFYDITGRRAPASPIDARTYTQHGLPWYEAYEEAGDVSGSSVLDAVQSIKEKDASHGFVQQDDSTVWIPGGQVNTIHNPGFQAGWPKPDPTLVKDGQW